MKLTELKIGDSIKFVDYYTKETVIGILDKISTHGDYHVFQNTSNTHRRWFKILPDEIVARVKYIEEPIEL